MQRHPDLTIVVDILFVVALELGPLAAVLFAA